MKTNKILAKAFGIVAMASLAVVFSCQQDESPYATEASDVAEESVTDYYFEDADDMAGVSVDASSETDTGVSGGKLSSANREISIPDDLRFSCATVTVTIAGDSEPAMPKGTVLIDFGTGCEGPGGTTRSGQILITFSGRRFQLNSTLTIELINYVVNGIKLEGTRVLTNLTPDTESYPKFGAVLTGGKATWPDGTEALRAHEFVREWIRMPNPTQDEVHVTGLASGTNKRGKSYTMVIVEPIVYKRGCPIAISGVKEFTNVESGRVITIDYGTGDCDNVITITVDGNSRSVSVGKRG